ncbi:MAG: J domain-containing protein [Actinobacteria bacterium]|nr:J domain-containing protein [Actinomycetota bacterium]
MDRDEAARVLGVAGDAPPEDVRAAYRRLIRRHHPDTAGPGDAPTATTDASLVIEAWGVLRAAPGGPAEPSPAPAGPGAEPVAEGPAATAAASVWVEGDTVLLPFAREEAFLLLLDCASDLGEVTYLDPDLGLVESVVTFVGTGACSLVVSFQGRADHIDAFCTVEALDGGPAPRADAVADLLARTARARLAVSRPG